VVVPLQKARGLIAPRPRVPRTQAQRRWQRCIKIAAASGGGLVLLGGLWIVVTGFMARTELLAARADLSRLQSEINAGDLAPAQATAEDLAGHARQAYHDTTGPAWALAAAVPVGGDPVRTTRAIASSGEALGRDALPALIAARLNLAMLRNPDDSINIAAISAAAPALAEADRSLAAAAAAIAAQPAHTWLGVVDHARSELVGPLAWLAHTVRSADIAAQVAPGMLGSEGLKRYFVGFQNDAEARGTGGLPGAFGILEANHGKLAFTRFEKDSVFGTTLTGLYFGADYAQLYGSAQSTKLYLNSNLSPHFPYAAQIWAAMWERYSGEHIDAAIAVDPMALSYLLGVIGAVTLTDQSRVTAGNVVALTQSGMYAEFSNATARSTYLLDVARSIGSHVVHAHGSTTTLVDALARAAGERRLLIWSADPAIEALLEETTAAGSIPVTSAPYAGLSIVNDGGNKLDYYLDRSIRWQRTGCGAYREVTVTIALTNGAPASGLPAVVTERHDNPGYPVRPGDNRLEVGYFATAGAVMNSVTVDGKPATASSGTERGHPVLTVDLELPRGSTRTVVFHLTEPAGSGTPVVLRQPLVRPLLVSLEDSRCD
jgi:Protein of unknown function (DUF4012)